MVPEFKEILVRSKPVKGDHDGRKKLYAQRIFTLIYMLVDFKSPLRDMQEEEKLQEALRCSELTVEDITDQVKAALGLYEWYQQNSARSLRTLKAMRTSLNQLDNYFLTINFSAKDKKGELLHSAKEYLANMSGVKKAYESYEEFEERVHNELTKTETVRGEKTLGGKEGKRLTWDEGKRPAATSVEFKELATDLFGAGITQVDQEGDGASTEDKVQAVISLTGIDTDMVPDDFDPDAEQDTE